MSVVDMVDMENQLGELVDAFEERMLLLFEEDPGLFKGRSTETEWKCQVKNAGLDLIEQLGTTIEKVEVRLHNGEYLDELRTWQKEAGCLPEGEAW